MKTIAGLVVFALLVGTPVLAQDEPPANAKLIAEGYQFPEGPLVDKDGNLYFTDVRGALILKYDGENVTTFAKDTHGANGLALDKDGNIYGCQGEGRAIAKFAPDGTMSTHLSEVDGAPLYQTNDIVIDLQGNIFFTNPQRGGDESSVVRLRPDGTAAVVATDQQYPNGIGVSPDGKTLYVNDLMSGGIIWKYPLDESGEVGAGEKLITIGGFPDGMAIAASGNIYCAQHAAGTIQVISPSGETLRSISFGKASGVTNMCFGGPDFKTLYVTLGRAGKVYALPNDEPGMKPYSHR